MMIPLCVVTDTLAMLWLLQQQEIKQQHRREDKTLRIDRVQKSSEAAS